MLHDIASYKTGDAINHAQRGALEAAEILHKVGEFSQKKINEVCQAISKHSAKDQKDGALAELLKDADVLQHFLYNPALHRDPNSHWRQRGLQILSELSIDLQLE